MKLNIILTTYLALAASVAIAQTPDTAKIIVHYKFIHVRDSLNKDKPYTENMMLLAGANASVYKSLDRKLRNAQMQAGLIQQVKESAGGPQNFNIKSSGSVTSSVEYFYFLNEHKAYRKELVFNSYIIDEPSASPQWAIHNDTLTLGGYHCQKATTRYKGRNYEAWFCADLPFHAGPWKLTGLPGLILQAADIKNEVVFKFDGIETVDVAAMAKAQPAEMPGPKVITLGLGDIDTPDYLVALPKKGIKSTEKELARLKEMRDKDPQAFLQASLAGTGMRLTSDNPSNFKVQTNAASASKPVINNPVELADNKK